jgi:hypothetical protein
VGGAYKFTIAQGDSFKVTVSADNIDNVQVEKTGDTLVIKRRSIEWFVPPFMHRAEATVYLPALTGIGVSGASDGTVANFHADTDLEVTVSGASHLQANNISTGKLDIKITGASTLKGDIKAQKEVKFEINGASKMDLAGAGTQGKLMVYGASKAKLGEFALQNASLDVSGASNAMINLNGRLDANVTGASHLHWSGTPVMGNIRASGASSLGNN